MHRITINRLQAQALKVAGGCDKNTVGDVIQRSHIPAEGGTLISAPVWS